jgi:hypothetical protein
MLDVRSNQKPKSFILMLFLFSTLVIAEACTRSSDANNSVVTLAIPRSRNASSKIESFAATETPQHIVVKISGSGMSPINYIWDGHGSAAAPTISLTVPQGPARLIQVLYVTQDPTQTLYFYYNDVTQDFTSANVSVALTVNSLSMSATQGQIIGKYLDSAGVGPTGILATVFQPPNGRPPMEVDRNEMFGGWFRAFALPSQAFNYVLEDGRILFKDFVVSPNAALGAYSTLITQPAGFRKFSGNSTYDPTSAQTILAGFFGPGATTTNHYICMNPATSQVLPNLYSDMVGTALLYSGNSCSGTSQVCRSVGGDTTDFFSAVCTNPDNISYVRFSENQLANRDSVMFFKGPFATFPSDNGAGEMAGSLIGSTLNLGWTFMSGAAANLGGVEIFYRIESSASTNGEPAYKSNNGYDCQNLVAKYGFKSAGQIPIPQSTLAGLNVGTVTPPQSLTAIACPYNKIRNPIYFNSAARWGSNDSQTPAPTISRILAISSSVYINNCQPAMVTLYDGANRSAPAQFPVTLTASSDNGTYLKYFSLSDCSDAPVTSTTVTFNQGESAKLLYFRLTGTATANLSVAASGMIAASGTQSVGSTTGTPGANPTSFGVLEPQFAIVGNCHPYLFELVDYGTGYGSVVPAGPMAINTIVSPGSIPLYMDSACVFPVNASSSISSASIILYGRASFPATSQLVGGTIGGLNKSFFSNTTNITY